jgi:hypothetical protein
MPLHTPSVHAVARDEHAPFGSVPVVVAAQHPTTQSQQPPVPCKADAQSSAVVHIAVVHTGADSEPPSSELSPLPPASPPASEVTTAVVLEHATTTAKRTRTIRANAVSKMFPRWLQLHPLARSLAAFTNTCSDRPSSQPRIARIATS